MARKVFQDFANALPLMLVGERMFDEREVLAALPDGTLTIDVLAGRASHSATPDISLQITGELRAWLLDRMAQHKIAPEELDQALVTLRIRTDRIPTDRKYIVSFDFQSESSLVSGPRTYRGAVVERHVWHNRATGGGRV